MPKVVSIPMPSSAIRAALDAAVASTDPAGGGLQAPTDAMTEAKVSSLWVKIEIAITTVSERGRKAADAAVKQVIKAIEGLATVGNGIASQVTALIMKRLSKFVNALIATALKLVPSRIIVGDAHLDVQSLSVVIEHMFSGSLKASVLDALELVAEGRLGVEVHYAPAVAH